METVRLTPKWIEEEGNVEEFDALQSPRFHSPLPMKLQYWVSVITRKSERRALCHCFPASG